MVPYGGMIHSQTARGSLTFRFLGTFFSACCFWAVSMAWRSCGLFSGQLKSGDSRIEKRYIMAYDYRINVNCKLRQDIPECESKNAFLVDSIYFGDPYLPLVYFCVAWLDAVMCKPEFPAPSRENMTFHRF